MALKFNPFTGNFDFTVSAEVEEKAKGVPTGGATSTVLMKKSATNYDDEWALVANANVAAGAAIAESKLSIPEMVTLGTKQTITGGKTFTAVTVFAKLEAETIQMIGTKELDNASIITLNGTAGTPGYFALEEFAKLFIGAKPSNLKQIKISGEVAANSTIFSSESACAYGVIPEGGATVIESAASQGKHCVIFLVNVSTTETVTLVHNATGLQKGLASNRFEFASKENVKLEPGQAIMLWSTEGEASGAKERWRDLGGWSINLPRASAGTGLERAAGNVFAVKALGITEALLAAESVSEGKIKNEAVSEAKLKAEAVSEGKIKAEAVTRGKLKVEGVGAAGKVIGWKELGSGLEWTSGSGITLKEVEERLEAVDLSVPLEIAAGKTYEIPSNVQGLWKESISVQGTLNIQGRFDEVGTPETVGSLIGSEEITAAKLATSAVTEPKLANGAVTTRVLAAGAVTEAKIGALAVTEGKLGEEAVSERTIKNEAVTEAKIKNEAITPAKLSQFSRDAPYEIPAGKTCEVPELYQGLFKENLSIQGTLNLQGRFDEVGVPEPFNVWAPTGVPYEIPSGKTYEVPELISSLWRDNISVQGTMNVQGRLTEV